MTNQNDINKESEEFVKRVATISLLIAIVIINLIANAVSNTDSIRSFLAGISARAGNYSSALELNDKITDDSLRKSSTYSIAGTMLDNGDYTEASELFGSILGYEDSESLYLESEYSLADEYFRSGDYDKALDGFTALGGYSDTAARVTQTVYAKADAAHSNKDYVQAVMLFISLGEYHDARDKAYAAALAYTGDEQMAQKMLDSEGMDEDELRNSILVSEKRDKFPTDSIAAGSYHTVILHADGTVSAFGDNSKKQCSVSKWTDIVSVHAGARHTVGLKSDGTVVAVGDNSFGQCNVSDWKGVTKLAVCDNSTIGLFSDGTIRSCGFNDYSTLERSVDITDIHAGGYSAVAVTGSGTCVSSHKSASVVPDGKIIDIELNTGYVLVLYNTGRCQISFDTGESWDSMVCAAAGPNGLVGADLDGNVRSHFFRKTDTIDFSSASGICQCAAGTGHYVFLSEDGRLFAFGDNSYGQCDLPDSI